MKPVLAVVASILLTCMWWAAALWVRYYGPDADYRGLWAVPIVLTFAYVIGCIVWVVRRWGKVEVDSALFDRYRDFYVKGAPR